MHCNRHGRFDCTDPVCVRWYAEHNYTVPGYTVDLDTGDLVITVDSYTVDLDSGIILA